MKTPPPSKETVLGDYRLTDDETTAIITKYLTPSQADDAKVVEFILRYVGCRNASQAARDAGLATYVGQRLLGKSEIYHCIRALTDKALMKYGYDAEEVVERVKEIVGIDPVCFENADGSFKTHLSQIPPEARRAIKKFKVKNIFGEDANGIRTVIGQLVDVELWDKMKGVELLGREKNIFKETKRVEHDVTTNMASVLLESKARADQRVIEARAESTLQTESLPEIVIEGDSSDINGREKAPGG